MPYAWRKIDLRLYELEFPQILTRLKYHKRDPTFFKHDIRGSGWYTMLSENDILESIREKIRVEVGYDFE